MSKHDGEAVTLTGRELQRYRAMPGLLAALEKIADTLERAVLVQDRSVHIIKHAMRLQAAEARAAVAKAREA